MYFAIFFTKFGGYFGGKNFREIWRSAARKGITVVAMAGTTVGNLEGEGADCSAARYLARPI